MLVRDYSLPLNDAWRIRVGESARVFRDCSAGRRHKHSPDILVWRGALRTPQLEDAFNRPNWALEFLENFPLRDELSWGVRRSGGFEDGAEQLPLTQLRQICIEANLGRGGGNAVFDLSIREYTESEESLTGDLPWWNTVAGLASNGKSQLITEFTQALIRMLKSCADSGVYLCVEQISLIISKDDQSPLASLTPTLHSDEFYGPMETALVSLSEDLQGLRGTLFAPTRRMHELEQHRPIDIEKMMVLLHNDPILEAQSGDMLLYGGMKDGQGEVSTRNGTPHISCDQPGKTARLVILMKRVNSKFNQAKLSRDEVH